jgi:hypothetical protein
LRFFPPFSANVVEAEGKTLAKKESIELPARTVPYSNNCTVVHIQYIEVLLPVFFFMLALATTLEREVGGVWCTADWHNNKK